MFDRLRRARTDLTVMNALLRAAERIARDDGIDEPGAEHLLLATVELDDGIAAHALSTFHADTAALHDAVNGQHDEALRSIGVFADENAIAAALAPAAPPRGPYRAQGSLQDALQRAVALAKDDGVALNSGYLLLAVTEPAHGSVQRSLEHLGIDRELLRDHLRRRLGGHGPQFRPAE